MLLPCEQAAARTIAATATLRAIALLNVFLKLIVVIFPCVLQNRRSFGQIYASERLSVTRPRDLPRALLQRFKTLSKLICKLYVTVPADRRHHDEIHKKWLYNVLILNDFYSVWV